MTTAARTRPVPSPPGRAAAVAMAALLALATLVVGAVALPGAVQAQPDQPAPTADRIGTDPDPVLRAVEIEQARLGAHGPAARIVVGRADVFADSLAAAAVAGADGALLLVDGGPDAALREAVADQVEASLQPGTCEDGEGPQVIIAGGEQAVSAQVQSALEQTRACTTRLAGGGRVATAIALAGAVPDPSGTVVLARADDWADAGAVGAWAAATRSPLLVTGRDALLPEVADALRDLAPDRIVLAGGVEALSGDVEAAAADIAPVQRVAGEARDATAAAIADQLWTDPSEVRYLADGYGDADWTTLFAAAPLAAADAAPILYTADEVPTPATQAHLDALDDPRLIALGPDDRPVEEVPPDLAGARVELVEVGRFDAPLMAKVRPGTDELWVAERAGRVVALAPDGSRRTVLDIRGRVSTGGERGLLGLAFDPAGDRLFTSHTTLEGDSVVERFEISGDVASTQDTRGLIIVQQPASNHNGGDLQWGPDGFLWWSLGDGGGGGDQFRTAQDPDALLGSMLRVDPETGLWERWANGLRNPFRFDFDDETGDLYIADVGQGQVEEIDWVAAGTPAGTNFGWSFYEGSRRYADPYGTTPPDDLTFPVFEEPHSQGNCSITGGVVYRGDAIPDLQGAYLYSDLCRSSVRAILVEGGQVTQSADLGVGVDSPVGFATDVDGEVLVLSIGGRIARLVPAG